MKGLIILGPTAIGKSKIAVEVAKKINGEIISADSSQVYRGFDILSGKITKNEMQNVKHHLIDILNFDEEFNVALFKKMAEEKIESIIKSGKYPIICGGTGLYIKALIDGYNFFSTKKDDNYREYLEKLKNEKGLLFLYNMLKEKNIEKANKINENDKVRIIRALEIEHFGGKEKKIKPKFDYVTIILNEERKVLYEKINKRVDEMINEGGFEEVENLIKQGASQNYSSFKAIGYKEISQYFLQKNLNKEETVELIKKHTRNYAKRQLTWLRMQKNTFWLDISQKDLVEKIIEIYKSY